MKYLLLPLVFLFFGCGLKMENAKVIEQTNNMIILQLPIYAQKQEEVFAQWRPFDFKYAGFEVVIIGNIPAHWNYIGKVATYVPKVDIKRVWVTYRRSR